MKSVKRFFWAVESVHEFLVRNRELDLGAEVHAARRQGFDRYAQRGKRQAGCRSERYRDRHSGRRTLADFFAVRTRGFVHSSALWRSRSRSFDCAYFNESAWRHSGSGERGIRSRREVYRAFQNRRFAFRSHLPKILFRSRVTSFLARRPASLRPPTRQTPNCNPMELTITQNGALYAVQHRPAPRYRGNLQKRVTADLIRALPTLTTSMEKFTMRPIPAEKAQSAPQNTGAQVADAFP